jgi:hypothetical protein
MGAHRPGSSSPASIAVRRFSTNSGKDLPSSPPGWNADAPAVFNRLPGAVYFHRPPGRLGIISSHLFERHGCLSFFADLLRY